MNTNPSPSPILGGIRNPKPKPNAVNKIMVRGRGRGRTGGGGKEALQFFLFLPTYGLLL